VKEPHCASSEHRVILALNRTILTRFGPPIALLALVLLVASCGAPGDAAGLTVAGSDASPDALPEIVGSYVVNGIDPLGANYGGVLVVTPGKSEGEYQLQWIITGSVQEGVGVLKGNRLEVQWKTVDPQPRQSHGETLYTITTRGELYGTRTVEGYPGEGREAAFPN